MAAAANYKGILQEYQDTYWYSNAVAMHQQLNQGPWRRVEARLRLAAREVEAVSWDGRVYAPTVCAFEGTFIN